MLIKENSLTVGFKINNQVLRLKRVVFFSRSLLNEMKITWHKLTSLINNVSILDFGITPKLQPMVYTVQESESKIYHCVVQIPSI